MADYREGSRNSHGQLDNRRYSRERYGYYHPYTDTRNFHHGMDPAREIRNPDRPSSFFQARSGYDVSGMRGRHIYDRTQVIRDDRAENSHRSYNEHGAFGSGDTRMTDGFNHRRASHRGRGPKNWRKADDRIHDEVCVRLADDPDIDASTIEVEVNDGMVTLSGEVENRVIKRMAEDVIDKVSGVLDVHNRIKVRNRNQESTKQ